MAATFTYNTNSLDLIYHITGAKHFLFAAMHSHYAFAGAGTVMLLVLSFYQTSKLFI